MALPLTFLDLLILLISVRIDAQWTTFIITWEDWIHGLFPRTYTEMSPMRNSAC